MVPSLDTSIHVSTEGGRWDMTRRPAATRLEDFGASGTVPPAERLRTYREQAKDLPPKVRARFWLGVLERDPEVKRLAAISHDRRQRH